MRKNESTLKGLNVNKGFVFNQIGKCYTYAHSTPLGLVRVRYQNPQVAPVAIISLRSLLRFIFNPFRGYLAPLVTAFDASGAHFPQVAPVAIQIQPLSGLDNYVINLLYFTQSGNAIYRYNLRFFVISTIGEILRNLIG
jgi:hypothetical protein